MSDFNYLASGIYRMDKPSIVKIAGQIHAAM